MIRKICVVTATRAEYGALKPLLDSIENDAHFQLMLVVTGTHLSPEFGLTVQQIRQDGFRVCKEIEIVLSSDSSVGVCKSMGLAQISFAETFDELKPDLVFILGDRYEILPVASVANILRIPVAHLNGGELTEGAIDEVIRHSVTKLSHIHFTALEEYRLRVIQMGEHPNRVFNIGEIGLDNAKRMKLLTKKEFEISIDCSLNKKNLLITYHPETVLSKNQIKRNFQVLIDSLDNLEDTLLIFTKSNADVGGRLINTMIDQYVAVNQNKALAFSSLGQQRYLSALKYIDAIVGNSSSGIVEAPTFGVASINIGERQKGRIRAESVLDVPFESCAITKAIELIYRDEYQAMLKTVKNPYEKKNSAQRVVQILKSIDFDKLLTKSFCDIKNASLGKLVGGLLK